MSESPSDDTFQQLARDLRSNDAHLHQRAAETLAELGGSQASKILINAIEELQGGVRAHCIIALGKLGDKQAVEPLLRVLSDDSFCYLAAWALGQLEDKRAVEPLINLLNDTDWFIRSGAVKALGNIGDDRAVEPLSRIMNNNREEWDVCRDASNSLGQLGEAALQPLLQSLQDDDAETRFFAANALGKLGLSQAVDSLIPALQDSDANVRLAAAGALGEIGDDRATHPLMAALNDEDFRIRRSVVWTLGKIGDDRATDVLITVLNNEHEDMGIRKCAVDSLEQIGSSYALAAVRLWRAKRGGL